MWILVTIALFFVGIGSVEFTADRPANPTMITIFAISLAVAGLGLTIEAKRDFYSFCSFAIFFGLIATIITGAVALLGVEPHPVAATVACLTGAATLGCVVSVVRTQFASERLPNVLRVEFPNASIYEVEGVQLATFQSAAEVRAGDGFEIKVFAQNCWDRERTLVFGLKPETRISLNRATLVFDQTAQIRLGGAEVGVLIIPVLAEPSASGSYSLVASPRVEGEGGMRVRRRRAQALTSQIPPWVTALGALGGMLVHGGGLKFKATVRKGGDLSASPVSALPAHAEIVWRPDP